MTEILKGMRVQLKARPGFLFGYALDVGEETAELWCSAVGRMELVNPDGIIEVHVKFSDPDLARAIKFPLNEIEPYLYDNVLIYPKDIGL